MMGEFKQELRDGFIEACLHLVNRDYDALAEDFVTLGYFDFLGVHSADTMLLIKDILKNDTYFNRLLPPTADKEEVSKALTGPI